ncbi:MAG: AraC family transcriptional regulator [Verrucomicrobiales bacterium]|nr:AraC family transcriptional regulator [Verrucomicrobiales bacterium]
MAMNRRDIPSYEFHDYGQENLRRQGVMAIPFEVSVAMEPRRLRPHYHDFFQVFRIVGPCRLMHDFREFHLTGTNAVFVSPGQVHTLHPGGGMQGVQVSFTQDFFDHGTPPPSGLTEFPFLLHSGAEPFLPLPEPDTHGISPVFAELQQEYDRALPKAGEMLRALLLVLCVRIHRLLLETRPHPGNSRASQVTGQFTLAVEHHFREKWTVADYARHLHLTPNHLNDTVREQTGHSAGELIRRRILLDARRLLLHSELGVAEIAYQLGFPDPSYFSRFFRRADGRTPAAFRQEIREKYH